MNILSLNILKLYQAIGRHIEKYPEDAKRFPNFAPEKRTKLARGCEGPIGGEIHSAQYFHGRFNVFSLLVSTVVTLFFVHSETVLVA